MTEQPRCYNRPEYRSEVTVQTGWDVVFLGGVEVRVPMMETIPDPMSKGCQQWGELGEARLKNWNCTGCKWLPK